MASLIGKPAPDFSSEAVLPDGTFGKVSLSDYKGKYVVLFCYPLSWTFVCPTEIQEFSNAAAELAKVNCEVVGFSVDSKFSTLAWTQSPAKAGGLGPINIPIMEDLNHEISNAYQCLLDDGHTLRGTFIISDTGVIRHLSMNDPPVGRSIDEVVRLVKGYQFVDKNGEVCPAKWQPGGATIIPDPEKKRKYFEAEHK